ncbi:MAG TPA: selenocysteine-specific translation elongation factor [Longimicrobiales bacterium]|nr:selenocysteine-specific translation elongation factor [Longimicrobiales bacterium]
MRSLILGTAGHIDHGKTALVRALTGIDTDRLAEEKERGITIDLGFAELHDEELRLGVVDVPGHEGFVRNMLAGATGMDVVVLVVAADEGVMPQTREHHAILRLLGVRALVVALTKADLVEPDWLGLAEDDVRDLLDSGPFAGAPIVATSATTGEGLEELGRTVFDVARRIEGQDRLDLTMLPVDRVFTIRGTGTVVTGTLWSGRLKVGDRVDLVPGDIRARVRGLQVHGEEVDEVDAGHRAAVALTGDGVGTDTLYRGQTLVTLPGWEASRMLTARIEVLDTDWSLEKNQRVRVHVGTAEVMARCVLLGADRLDPGEEGWVQLRLEQPVLARARQRVVLRSYSPVLTFAGGAIVEVFPPKRRPGASTPTAAFEAVSAGGDAALSAALELAGPAGVAESLLPVVTGHTPGVVATSRDLCLGGGAISSDGHLVGRGPVAAHREAVLAEVRRIQAAEPYRAGAPVESLRALAPPTAPKGFTDAVIKRSVEAGELVVRDGDVAEPSFRPSFSPAQTALLEDLGARYAEAGLAPPTLDELPEAARSDPAFLALIRRLEDEGRLVQLEPGLLVDAAALEDGITRTRAKLGGAKGLGPADFKEVFPVSRRHLLPILRYLDRSGVTRNTGDVRDVLPDNGRA